jgi:hypothetical protein
MPRSFLHGGVAVVSLAALSVASWAAPAVADDGAAGAAGAAGATATGPSAVRASTSATVLQLEALDVAGLIKVADVGIGTSTGSVEPDAERRTAAAASNLPASLAGLPVSLLAGAQQSAPPEQPSPAKATAAAGTVPLLLDLGASEASARARWAGDSACPPAGEPFSTSSVSTAQLSTLPVPLVGTLISLPDTVSSQQSVALTSAGSSTGRGVVSTATGSTADLRLLGDQVRVGVTTAPRLSATAAGSPGGAQVRWEAPVLDVTLAGESRTLPADGSPLNLVSPDNPLLTVQLSAGQVEDVVEAADGTTASATASVVDIAVRLGTGPLATTLLEAELFPLSASATAPAGGVVCPVVEEPVDQDPDGDGLPTEQELELGTDPDVADTDEDGLNDGAEVNEHETDPTVADTDEDGLNDGAEVNEHETDPTVADTDTDGLDDGAEVNEHETDPTLADTDTDGLRDGAEVSEHRTDPTVADTDRGGVDDGIEVATNRDPLDPTDDAVVVDQDPDRDGLTTLQELELGTDPTVADTDGDGLTDGAEVKSHGTDPRVGDTDKDGLGDGAEVGTHRTDPRDADTDRDGLTDGREVASLKTDPLHQDTDRDGLTDGREVTRTKTDPRRKDTDGDRLADGREVTKLRTDPRRKDTDRDGLTDGREVLRPASGRYPRCHTNPRRKDTDRDGLTDRVEIRRWKTNPCDRDTDNGGVSDGAEVRAGSDPRDVRSGPRDVR